MKFKTIIGASVLLLGLAAQADPLTVFINGIKYNGSPVELASQTLYPLDELAKALGVPYQMGEQGALLNGVNLASPAVVVSGRPYTTLEIASKTVGATCVRDPVRGIIQITSTAKPGAGFAYYSADYKTPAQQAMEKATRESTDAGLPEHAQLEAKRKQQMKAYDTLMPAGIRPTLPDFDLPSMPHPNMIPETGLAQPNAPSTNLDELRSGHPSVPEANTLPPTNASYMVRAADNGVFKLIVKDVKIAEVLKGMDPPAQPNPGFKFIVIYVTEENMSKGFQSPAWFSVHDITGAGYTPDANLSDFSMSAMRGREVTSGFLVTQMPIRAVPSSIEVLCSPPLSLSLAP